MGAFLCSQEPPLQNNLHEYLYTEESSTFDERDDSDDINNDFNFDGVRTSTMPEELRQVLHDAAEMRRRTKSAPTSRECTLRKEPEDWHRSSVVNREEELKAERYCKMICDSSLGHLSDTIRTASSILDKGTALNDELTRQDRVLSKAENDIAITEYETDQTSKKLKGMKSLRGKLSTMVRKKDPELKEFSRETRSFVKVNLDLLEDDIGLSAFSKMGDSPASSISKDKAEDTESVQAQMRAGIGHLNKTLDAIRVQQTDTTRTLGQQDERLSMFENRISSTHQKINCQTQMINSIMGK